MHNIKTHVILTLSYLCTYLTALLLILNNSNKNQEHDFHAPVHVSFLTLKRFLPLASLIF